MIRYSCAVALLIALAPAKGPLAQEPYRNPIVFARTHFDVETGEPTHNAKIWVMEEDGSRQRQLTFGTQYDDHPATLFSDQRHVLYSEFNGPTFPRPKGLGSFGWTFSRV